MLESDSDSDRDEKNGNVKWKLRQKLLQEWRWYGINE